MKSIDLSSDVGEGLWDVDRALMGLITSASIACGGHAGDERTIESSIRDALANGLRIGAHPAYPDRINFGRQSQPLSPDSLMDALMHQVGVLMRIATDLGGKVKYIKPHGALYNDAFRSREIASVLLDLSAAYSLPIMVLANSRLADGHPDRIIREGFIDRAYRSDGSLTSRHEEGALILDPGQAARQAIKLARDVDSLCVHSDTPGAVEILAAARSALLEIGCVISAS